MSLIGWIIAFALNSLFWKWIISWGGAQQIEGWKSLFVIGSTATHWNAEQIRFYGMIIWFFSALWFLLGLFFPEIRTH